MRPKIVYGQFQNGAEYSFAQSGVFLSSNEYIMTVKDYPPKCLLAFLNCKAMEWLLGNLTGNLGGNSKIGQKSNFLKLSIPILPHEMQKDFDNLVDSILSARKDKDIHLSVSYEQIIDKRIYEIIGLTNEEIQIIESQHIQS